MERERKASPIARQPMRTLIGCVDEDSRAAANECAPTWASGLVFAADKESSEQRVRDVGDFLHSEYDDRSQHSFGKSNCIIHNGQWYHGDDYERRQKSYLEYSKYDFLDISTHDNRIVVEIGLLRSLKSKYTVLYISILAISVFQLPFYYHEWLLYLVDWDVDC